MKRYLAWSGVEFYASGPVEDFIGDFETIDELEAEPRVAAIRERLAFFAQPEKVRAHTKTSAASKQADEWLRVLDTQTGEWVIRDGPIYQERP